jgi:hypothetical protein
MKDYQIEKTEGWSIVYKEMPHISVGWHNMYSTKNAAVYELERQCKTERETGRSEEKWRAAVMIVKVTKTVVAHIEEGDPDAV